MSRSSALASKATGYPIARVAAQIAVGRRSPRSRTPSPARPSPRSSRRSTTSSSSCRASRSTSSRPPTARLGTQMKATGEVMAIDRTFGAALNKALRGLEQAGAGPLAEDPAGQPTFDYLAAVYAGGDADDATRPARTTRRSAGSTSAARPARAPASRSARRRRSCSSGSSRRPTRGCGGCSRCCAAACPGADPRGDRDRALVPRRDGPQRRPRGATCATPAPRSWTPTTPTAPTLLATAKRAGFGDRDIATLAGVPEAAVRAAAARARPRARATRWSTRAPPSSRPRRRTSTRPTPPAGSPPEAPPVARPGRARHRQRPGPDRAGDRVRLLRRPGRRHRSAARAGSAIMVNSNPETVSTDFDASTRLYFEPLDAESVLERHRRRDRRTGRRPAAGGRRVRRPDAAQPRRAAGRGRRAAARLATSRPSTRPRSGRGSRRSSTGSASRSPKAAWPSRSRRRSTLAERIGYPVIVRPVVRHRRPRHRLLLLARGPRPPARRGRRSSTPTGPSGSTATSRASRSTSTRSRDGERRADPGPARARRARRRPLAATRSACSRRSTSARPTRR